jgi:hypothetical protein
MARAHGVQTFAHEALRGGVRGYDGGLPWHREEHAAVTGLQSTIVEASRRSGGGEGAVCDGNKHKEEGKEI